MIVAGARRFALYPVAAIAAMLGGRQVEGVAGAGSGDSFHSASLEAVIGSGGRQRRPAIHSPRHVAVRSGTRSQAARVVSGLPNGGPRVTMFNLDDRGRRRSYTFIGDRLVSTPPGTLRESHADRQ